MHIYIYLSLSLSRYWDVHVYIYIIIFKTCILQQIAGSCSANHANEHSDCSLASLVLLSPPMLPRSVNVGGLM